MTEMYIPTYDDVTEAHERIRPYIHRTPVLTSSFFNNMTGAELFFKCENFQKAGAFKARGASNAVFGLSDDMAAKGVATHSSGNHGLSLSYAAGAARHSRDRGHAQDRAGRKERRRCAAMAAGWSNASQAHRRARRCSPRSSPRPGPISSIPITTPA